MTSVKENNLSRLSIDELTKKRNLLKGVLIGFSVIYLLAIVVVIYLLAKKNFKDVSVAALIPVFAIPITFASMLVNLNVLNKEIKSREQI